MRVVINTVKRIVGNPNNPNPNYLGIGDIFISIIALTGVTYIMFEKTNK